MQEFRTTFNRVFIDVFVFTKNCYCTYLIFSTYREVRPLQLKMLSGQKSVVRLTRTAKSFPI